jgi:subtilisin family serine protease
MRLSRALLSGLVLLLWLGLALPAHAANDPGLPMQWGMQLIGAPEAWSVGTGAGVTIAVIDTGVDDHHEDLAGKVTLGPNYVTPGAPSRDDNGHGTHVAGIAGAITNNGRGVVGVAPDARILSVKVLGSNGTGGAPDAAIKWAADNGARVINLSLGDTFQPVLGPGFSDAITYAWGKGAICVVAAGNDFVTSSGFSKEPAMVVSAVTRNDTKPSYSSGVGSAQWGIAAPGGAASLTSSADDVLSTWWDANNPSATNTYAYDAGTSMAAPHVAGAAAVLLSLGLTPDQTVQRLLNTAKDIGTKGNDSTFGHGRLDVAAAVRGLKPQGSAGQAGSSTTSASPAGTRGTQATSSTSRGATGALGAQTPSAGATAPPTGAGAGAGPTGDSGTAVGPSNTLSAGSGLAPDVRRGQGPTRTRAGPSSSERPWLGAGLALAALILVSLAAVGLAGAGGARAGAPMRAQ